MRRIGEDRPPTAVAGHRPRRDAVPGATRGVVAGAAHGAPGFSLLELVTVIMLASVMAAIAAPRVDFVRFQMEGAAQSVNTTLLAAQRTAVTRQHDVVVAFDTVRGLMRIHEDANNDGAVQPAERARWVEIDDAVRFGRGTTPATSRTNGSSPVTFKRKQEGRPAVTFHRNGSASELGGFYLTSRRAAVSAKYRKDTRAIVVERGTGRASWYMYTGQKWIRGF